MNGISCESEAVSDAVFDAMAVKRLQAMSGSVQRSELEKRVRKVIEEVRESLRLGDPGAADAFRQLEVGTKLLVREGRALAEDLDAHREWNDDPEDHDEGEPTP